MKIVSCLLRLQNTQVALNISINGRAQFLRRNFTLHLNNCHLTLGMHAGVSASRSVNHNLAPLNQTEHPSQLALHRAQVILHLPAMKVCTVILER